MHPIILFGKVITNLYTREELEKTQGEEFK